MTLRWLRPLLRLLCLCAIASAAPIDTADTTTADRRQLIINGNQASPFEHTHVVGLTQNWQGASSPSDIFCGGSLLSATVVLTAAHCMCSGAWCPTYYVVVHTHDVRSEHACSATIRVSRVIVHEDYMTDTQENDVAVLHLSAPAPCAGTPEGTDIVRLDDSAGVNAHQGRMATVAGWGARDAHNRNTYPDQPDKIHEVDVQVQKRGQCRQAYSRGGTRINSATGEPFMISSGMLCASGDGTRSEGRDSCRGDSGGPLFFEPVGVSTAPDYDRRPIQIGIVSWALGCANIGAPPRQFSAAQFRRAILRRALLSDEASATATSLRHHVRLARRLRTRRVLQNLDRKRCRHPPAVAAASAAAAVPAG